MKRMISILLLACLLASLLVPVSAADTPLVVDESGYISPESLEALNAKAEEYSEECAVDLAALVTVTRLPDEPLPDFMKSYHESSGLSSDAVLLVIDPVNLLYGIYIFGEMEVLLGSEGQAELTELFEEHLAVEDTTYAAVIDASLEDMRQNVLKVREASNQAAAELEAVLREQLAQTDGQADSLPQVTASDPVTAPEPEAADAAPQPEARSDRALTICVAVFFVLLAAGIVLAIVRKRAKPTKN